MQEWITLVDRRGRAIGIEEKLQAHQQGKLHRAFSIFVFNARGEMLLQQRARHKYHSGGLWTNACCSHPRPGESMARATRRRLQEEMGFVCRLRKAFHFIYRAELDRGLIEHEFDHVYIGEYNGDPAPDPREVADCRWQSPRAIAQDLRHRPEHYTAWFRLAFTRAIEHHTALFPKPAARS